MSPDQMDALDGTPMRGVRDMLIAQLDKSWRGLEKHGATDTTVHVVRKELKRARASLRLMRECMGESVYRRENRILRDAARPLRDARDAKVLLHTFTELRRGREANAFDTNVARELQRERRESRERLQRRPPSGARLREARRRIEAVSEPQLDGVAVSAGIRRVYKSGLKAFAKVRQNSTDERLHEWRKQVKYLFNQIDILQQLSAGRFAKIHKRSHRLGDLLGEDHDLAVLEQKIIQIAKKTGFPGDAAGPHECSSRTKRRRSVLQRKALNLGKRLYSRRPKRLQAKIDKHVSRDAGST